MLDRSEVAMAEYTLLYFDGRGKAELIRLIFACAGIEFEDRRIDRGAEWPELKSEMPLHHVPVLVLREEGRKVQIPNSQAIARFLCKRFGLYGSGAIAHALIDAAAGHVDDMGLPLGELLRAKAAGALTEADKESAAAKLLREMKALENFTGKRDGEEYIVGNNISLADLALLNMLSVAEMVGVPISFQHLPKLERVKKTLEGHSRLKHYLETRPPPTWMNMPHKRAT